MEEAAILDLVVLSPCFYETSAPARLMLESAAKYGLQTLVYGVGKDFIPHGAHAQVDQLYCAMKKEKLANWALVTDCRDVLFLTGMTEILEKFWSFNSRLVMSAEVNCWPSDEEVVKHFSGKTKYGYDYVNAGQYIGTWDYVLLCLKHLLEKYRFQSGGLDNSQAWWPKAILRGELDVALDSQCSIFQTMSGGVDGHVHRVGWRVFNSVTKSTPCTVHFNGNPNTPEPHRSLWESFSK